jgi:hypothetical protein
MSYHSSILLMLLFVHRKYSDSLFVNHYFQRGMIGKYQNTFLGMPFLLFLL